MSINGSGVIKCYYRVPYVYIEDVGAVAEFTDDEENLKVIEEPKKKTAKQNGWVTAIRDADAARKEAARKEAKEEAEKLHKMREEALGNLNLILMNLLEKDVRESEREEASIKTWKTFLSGHAHLAVAQANKHRARRAGEIAYVKELMREVAKKLIA
jgi:hypothetical protein